MSRHEVIVNEKTYTYGFDACVPEYFLMSCDKKGNIKYLVGCMSNLLGTAGNLLQGFKKHKLLGVVPDKHITLTACDLPIPQGEYV